MGRTINSSEVFFKNVSKKDTSDLGYFPVKFKVLDWCDGITKKRWWTTIKFHDIQQLAQIQIGTKIMIEYFVYVTFQSFFSLIRSGDCFF